MTKKGHGQKLSRHGEKVLAALLKSPTVSEAAKESGISPSTIFRWLQDEDFLERYREAQRTVVDEAIGTLQAATTKAVAILVRNLDSSSAFVANRAAQLILTQALKAIELNEILERVGRLERMLARQQKGRRRA
jgi:hypothetical protein